MGIYRENGSSEKIGIFDEALVVGLPSSVRWIAHNGAGYGPVDVRACKAQGNCRCYSDSNLCLIEFCIRNRHPSVKHPYISQRCNCHDGTIFADQRLSPFQSCRMFHLRTEVETERNWFKGPQYYWEDAGNNWSWRDRHASCCSCTCISNADHLPL